MERSLSLKLPEAELSSESSAPRAFSSSSVSNHPELAAVYDRLLSVTKWKAENDGVVLFVPTSFHAAGLRRLEAQLAIHFGQRIKDYQVRKLDLSDVAPTVKNVTIPVAPQTTLPLGVLSQRRENSEDIERKNRVDPPRLISSPAFAEPQRLVKRWAEGVNQGTPSQVLWLYGQPGAGKTQLLKQLHAWLSVSKRLKVVDVMSFFHEWRQSIENGSTIAFAQKYRRDVDVLVLENIDDLINKSKTQEEILFTAQALMERGAHLVVSGTKHPLELSELLEPSLYSRLHSGLVVHLPAPDKAFKEAMWRSMLSDYGLTDMPQDVLLLERLFSVPAESARKVFTIFTNLFIRISLNKRLTPEDVLAVEAQHSYSRVSESPYGMQHQPSELVERVAQLCGLTRAAVLGKVRRADVCLARRFVCLALSKFMGLTNAAIAQYLEKDPSTISHAMSTIQEDLQKDRNIARQWNWICTQLGLPQEATAIH